MVGLAGAEYILGTPRSKFQWSKDKISSIGLWTGYCHHLGSKRLITFEINSLVVH